MTYRETVDWKRFIEHLMDPHAHTCGWMVWPNVLNEHSFYVLEADRSVAIH